MTLSTHISFRRSIFSGFTLVEMLAVLAIIAILAAASLPAITSVLNSYGLSSAGQSILGQLNFARQSALANNHAVQVRFYQIADSNGAPVYRAMQAFQESTDGTGLTIATPISKAYFLPSGMWMAYSSSLTTASTLFTTGVSGANTSAGDAANPLPPPYGVSPYIYFRFRPNGQTDLTASSLVTVASENARVVTNGLPANFVTLQIDAVNGMVRVYQP